MQIAEFTIGRPRDVAWSAQRARLLGSLAGLPTKRRASLGKAVSQCVQSVVDASATGTIQYGVTETTAGQSVEITLHLQPDASDDQTTVEPQPLSDSSFQEACEKVDELAIDHQDTGLTIVRIAQALPDDVEAIPSEIAGQWSTILAMRSTQGALATTQRIMSQLMEHLESVQTRGLDMERELENIKTLNETLELLALVASKTENAVIILDAESRVEWVNDGFVRMTGYELSDIRQHAIDHVLYGSDTSSESSSELNAALAAGHGISQDTLHHRKDGRTYWASISITPVFSEDGSVTRWICIANDVTRRRHVQEELRQAKDAAEAASRAKSEFLANMSHEIRTPMNAIIGMSELALDTTLDDEQREYLTTVLDSAEALLRLLNDILDLSKIEAHKLEIEKVEFPLVETLRDTLKAFTFQARQKGLRLDVQLPLHLPERLVGDPARLRQIITNLVGNAIKFTHSGEVVVSVSCANRTARHADLEFSVRDTGIGIAPDKLQAIFDAFTQADSSTNRRFGGTGLGLTISTQLVELMSGRIWVESKEGQGSDFRVALGFDLPSAVSTSEPISQETPAESVVTAARKLTVLVADDNRANRQLAMRILQKQGNRVAEAPDGRAVIERLQREAFDVLLLDVQMPGMDGLEATATIRQIEDELPRIPYIIAMTAHVMQGDRERCLAAGMDAYIAKPLRARQLLAMIEAVAKSPDTERSIEQPSAIAAFDFCAALDRLEGDEELLAEQMGFFLEDSPILIRDIRTAIASTDVRKLELSAHRLRGLAASFDAVDLVQLAGHLEDMGRSGLLSENLDEHQQQLERLWWALSSGLEDHLARTKVSQAST